MLPVMVRDAPAPDRLGGHGGGRRSTTEHCRPHDSVSPAVIRRYSGDHAAAGRALADLLLGTPAREEAADG